jgi:hypothetical protein
MAFALEFLERNEAKRCRFYAVSQPALVRRTILKDVT